MDPAALLSFILPAYIANSTPVVFGGGTKVDFGRRMGDGRRVFGDGKTYRGLLAAVVFGTFSGFVLAVAAAGFGPLSFRDRMVAALLLSAGAMAGDLLGSFIKRRAGIAQSSQHEFFDQLLFLGGAIVFAAPVYLPSAQDIGILVVATYFIHKTANLIAHRLKIKSVPW